MKAAAWILLGTIVFMFFLSFAGMLDGGVSTLLGLVVIVTSLIVSIGTIRRK
jgi:hypothetical protein